MRSPARFSILPAVVAGLLVLALVGICGAAIVFQVTYSGRAYPGVHLQGTDLTGMSPEEIFHVAQGKATFFRTPTINLVVSEQTLSLRPTDLGAGLDPAATTQRALDIGRTGDPITRLSQQVETWWFGTDIAPVVQFDDVVAGKVLAQLASEVQRAPRDASVSLENGGIREIPAQPGVVLDTNTSYALIQAAVMGGKRLDLTLPLTAVPPQITSASSAAQSARQLLSQDLVILVPKWDVNGTPTGSEEAFRIRKEDLSQFVTIDQVVQDGVVHITTALRRDKLAPMIEKLAPAVEQDVQDARFTYNDDTGMLQNIQPAKAGRTLNTNATLDAVQAVLNGSGRSVTLVVDSVEPQVKTDATAQQLGITRLITQATTYFKGSTAARMNNVKVAASRFHGVVVAPHTTFSFDKYLGDVSTNDGFEEGLVIVGDRTIKGVGGGVCQVSTTAYQAALRAGFPIVERYPHGYRVGYYERGMGPGFDATVFSPLVDLKFVNDTDAFLLIETYFDASRATLTFKFYGTPDDRQVTFTQPIIKDVVPHGPTIYEADPDNTVAPGKAVQVDYAVDGATITVERTVTRNGETLMHDKIVSKYVPWQAVYRYGPGFTPPPEAIVR